MRRIIFAQLTALLLAGNAASLCRAEGKTVLTCVMEGTDENGYLGMRVDVIADPDAEAYDLDVLYDVHSVELESVEERSGEPKAFEYKDYDQDGILRVVGLVGEAVVGEGTLLYIRWKPVSGEDVNYVPTLRVRDLADEAGEDIPCVILYEDSQGASVTPSLPKKSGEGSSDEGGTSDSGMSAPQGAKANAAAGGRAENAEADAAAQSLVLSSGDNTENESEADRGSLKAAGEKSNSDETEAAQGQTAGTHVNESGGESAIGRENAVGPHKGMDESGGESAAEAPDDSSVTDVNGDNGLSELKKARYEGGVSRAVFIGGAAVFILSGLYYYRRKRS